MKKILHLLMLPALLALAACSDDQAVPQFTLDNLSVSDRTIIIEATSTSAQLTVTANCQWTAELGSDKWDGLTINAAAGRVDIVTPVNETSAIRTATLTIRSQSGDITRNVSIQQNAGDVSLSLGTESYEAVATAGRFTVSLFCNSTWTLQTDQNWITATPVSGQGDATITVSCEDNTDMQARTAHLTFVAGSNQVAMTVTQQAATLPVLGELAVTGVGKSQATVSCSYTSVFEVEEYGICYSTQPEPTIDDLHIVRYGGGTAGDISEQITGLLTRTYFIRAYARSRVGIAYSRQQSFTTTGTIPGDDDNGIPVL